MSWIAVAVGGSAIISAGVSYFGSKEAAEAQGEAAEKGIAEQRRQFAAMQQALAPYQQAGIPALQAQQNLAGLGGAGAQQAAISQIEQGPQFQAILQQGENGILQNASATGGLRGGNTQAALAQFRPQLLSQLIDQQYARLGGLAALGQNSAAGVGAGGMQMAGAVGDLYGQQGAAQAGAAMGKWGAINQLSQAGAQLGGLYASGYGFGRSQGPPAWSAMHTTQGFGGLDYGGSAPLGSFGAGPGNQRFV